MSRDNPISSSHSFGFKKIKSSQEARIGICAKLRKAFLFINVVAEMLSLIDFTVLSDDGKLISLHFASTAAFNALL